MNNSFQSQDSDEREMWDIICDDCGKKAQVPFEPDGVRPVYCQECYRKRRRSRW